MPAVRPLSSQEIPQADSLSSVRRVLEAVANGLRAKEQISTRTGISRRHVEYALLAARSLGWLDGPDGLQVTQAGLELLATEAGSREERVHQKRALVASEIVRRVAPDLLDPRAPSKETIARRILRATAGLGQKTAMRRAQTLVAWRTQVLAAQLGLFGQQVGSAGAVPPDVARRTLGGAAMSPRGKPPDGALPPRSTAAGAPPLPRDPAAVPSPPPARSGGSASPGVLFPEMRLPDDLQRDILRTNPWWRGEPGVVLPAARRDFVATIHKRLSYRLAPILVVRGPRQVGKTTAQEQVIADLLSRGVAPSHILRVQCDELPSLSRVQEPVLRVVDWYEGAVLGRTLNAAAHAGEPTYLFFDEVQNLSDWAVQLKHLVDSSTTQVLVTGSSALRIEAGRDSLAGRINTIEVGTLTLREIARIRFGEEIPPSLNGAGFESLGSFDFWRRLRATGRQQASLRDRAFKAFSERGGYPLVHARADVPWEHVADQLNETIIRRVIQHDLRLGDRGRQRDPLLLEEVFRLACRYAGQAPTPDRLVEEAQRALRANVGVHRVRHYLDFLDRTLLLRLVRPLEIRLKRTQGAPKLCLADHGLRASWLEERIPLDPSELASTPELAVLAGHLAESVAGAYLLNAGGLDVAHFPERAGEPEIDFVLTVGARRIPIEVKYGRRIKPVEDTAGLLSFIARSHYNAPFGILVTQEDLDVELDPRVIALPLSSLLLMY